MLIRVLYPLKYLQKIDLKELYGERWSIEIRFDFFLKMWCKLKILQDNLKKIMK